MKTNIMKRKNNSGIINFNLITPNSVSRVERFNTE